MIASISPLPCVDMRHITHPRTRFVEPCDYISQRYTSAIRQDTYNNAKGCQNFSSGNQNVEAGFKWRANCNCQICMKMQTCR